MRVKKGLYGLIAGTVAATGAMMVPGAASAAPVRADDSDGGDAVVEHVVSSDAAAADYWTPERMRNAIPLQLDENGNRIDPGDLPESTETASKRMKTSPLSAGKLFFTADGLNYVCSASAIRHKKITKNKNLIATAGHCIRYGGTWSRNIAYVPRYKNGKAPKGVWRGVKVTTFKAWANKEAWNRDHAVVRVKPRRGKSLVKATAGNKIRVGAPRALKGVSIVGWPAESPYNGEFAYKCKGATKRDKFYPRSSDSTMRKCNMTGGASGGPWYSKLRKNKKGVVYTVTSRRYLEYPILLATPFPKAYRKVIKRAAKR